MKRKLVVVAALVVVFSAVSFICAAQETGHPQIVASYSVLADVVRRVTGDAADVTSLIPVGADPHSFEPTPRDVASLADADIVFVVGANFEEGLQGIIENAAEEINIIPASQCVEILPFGAGNEEHGDETHVGEEEPAQEGELQESAIAALCEAHHTELASLRGGAPEEHEHAVEPLGMLYAIDCGASEDEHEEEDVEHAHEAGSCDSHVWLDPQNVMLWVMLIRDTLSEIDPANAEVYRANAAAYLEELNTFVNDEMIPLIETLPVEKRVLVTDHEIFGYFANAYGFRIVGLVVPSVSTAAEPSAAAVAALIDTIRREQVPAIFVASVVDAGLAQQIAEEAGARVETVYTHSVAGPGGQPMSYIDLMRYNVRTIVDALNSEEA